MVWLNSNLRRLQVPVWCFPQPPFDTTFCFPGPTGCFAFPVSLLPSMPSCPSCSHPCHIHLVHPSALLEVLNIPSLLSLSHLLASNSKISLWHVLDLGRSHHLYAAGDLLWFEQSFPGTNPSPGELLKLGRAQITWERVPVLFSSGDTSVALYFH